MAFRNYVHHRFNPYRRLDLHSFEQYVDILVKGGGTEVEFGGRRAQPKRLQAMVNIVHRAGARAVLYTGVFGTEDVRSSPGLKAWAQRRADGSIAGYAGAGERAALLCPSSPYVEEIAVPEIVHAVRIAGFDEVFVDIPWLATGHPCANCASERTGGADDAAIVRNALERATPLFRASLPSTWLSVNASAPSVHDAHPGGHISNPAGLFDAYVTEWNPYRWCQSVGVIGRVVDAARQYVSQPLYHATTLTGRDGKLFDEAQVRSLAHVIRSAGATPRFGMGFPPEQLVRVVSWIRDS